MLPSGVSLPGQTLTVIVDGEWCRDSDRSWVAELACGDVAVDVDDEVGVGGCVDADVAVGADFGEDGVEADVVSVVVDVGGEGSRRAAGEHGEVAGAGGVCGDDVEEHCGCVVGDSSAAGDVDGCCVAGEGAANSLLGAVEGLVVGAAA